MGLFRRLADPDISRHLLRDEGEVIVDEVNHHWAAYSGPLLELLGALALLLGTPFVSPDLALVPMLIALGVLAHAACGALAEHMDRFVITNMRVFRVHGVLAQQVATMPLSRILDITVTKPLHGRLFGFGHFVFESAAQAQGLRDIRYVARPDQRDLAIQRVVARAGLRPSVN